MKRINVFFPHSSSLWPALKDSHKHVTSFFSTHGAAFPYHLLNRVRTVSKLLSQNKNHMSPSVENAELT